MGTLKLTQFVVSIFARTSDVHPRLFKSTLSHQPGSFGGFRHFLCTGSKCYNHSCQSIQRKLSSKIQIKHINNYDNIGSTFVTCNNSNIQHFYPRNISSKSILDKFRLKVDSLTKRHICTSAQVKVSKTLRDQKKVPKMGVARPKTMKPVTVAQPKRVDSWTCYAYSTAEEYNLEHLSFDLQSQGSFTPASMPTDAHDALHMIIDTKTSQPTFYEDDTNRPINTAHLASNEDDVQELSEMFIFRNGAIVFWNVQDHWMKKVLQTADKHQLKAYEIALVNWENENMPYMYDGNETRLENDTIYLDKRKSAEDLSLDKFAFSNAMVLSVKLAMWEYALDEFVASLQHIPESLIAKGKLKMSHSEVMRKVGKLYSISHRINLSSDLLISPDFYWDRDHLEKLYRKMCSFLSIYYRTNVVNQKLSHCSDLIDVMRSDVADVHSSRLEIMIILLIMIEVVFELIHFFRTSKLHQENTDV